MSCGGLAVYDDDPDDGDDLDMAPDGVCGQCGTPLLPEEAHNPEDHTHGLCIDCIRGWT